MCKMCQYDVYKKKCDNILYNPYNLYQRWMIDKINSQIMEKQHVTIREKEIIDNAIIILDIKNKARLKRGLK